jgi:alpha-beta hydrolase superfamily lysophospholipase
MLNIQKFEELAKPGPRPTPDEQLVLHGSDGTPLRGGIYRPVAGGAPANVILLQHGGSLNGGIAYPYLADQLRQAELTAVVVLDLRGHGQSGGPRGYASRPDLVWDDLVLTVRHLSERFPGARLHVVGHSSGAGVWLNALSRRPRLLEAVSSFSLIAPFLGQGVGHRRYKRGKRRASFSKVRISPFLLYLASGGRLAETVEVVRFNLPTHLQELGCVAAYTPGMALALTPSRPRAQLRSLQLPTYVLAASEDEVLCPDELGRLVVRPASSFAAFDVVEGNHLSCLLQVDRALLEFFRRGEA